MPNSLQNQEAILVEKLYSLRQSRGGYVATMSKLCSKIDELLQDNSQLVQVRSLQTALNDTFSSFRDHVELTQGLLPQDSIELQDVLSYYEAQEVRKRIYDENIDRYAIDVASFFNTKAPEAVTDTKISFPPSPARSVILQSSKASRISTASPRLEPARIAVEKAVLVEKQTEQKRMRSIDLRIKLLELEMRQKQFEFQHQLELAKLEAERQVDEAREKTEMAQLECKLAEHEYSCLLSEHEDDKEILHGDRQETNLASTMPTRPAPIARDPTRAISCPPTFAQPYAQPIVTMPVRMPSSTPTESRTFHAAPTRAPACYTISSGVSFRPTASMRESRAPAPRNLSTLPVSSSHPHMFPAFVSEDSVSPPMISNINAVPVASAHVSTLPASSAPERLHAVPSWPHLRRPTTSEFVTRRSSSAPVFQHNT